MNSRALVDSSASAPLVPLNYSEHGYLALEGLVGAAMLVFMVRLNQPVAPEEIRGVMRELVSAWPRLRGVVEPGWHMHRLRILADDTLVDQLFEQAWCVESQIDAGDARALEDLQSRLVNEVLPLERGLLCRFRWVPHPETPALLFSVHHLIADGRTLHAMWAEVMARLNGGPSMRLQPLDAPSMLHAVRPPHLWQWPRQMWRSRQHAKALASQLKPLNVQRVSAPWRSTPSYHMVTHHTLPVAASVLRSHARRLGVSVNSLITVCLAETYLAQAPQDPHAAAVIRTNIDIRRFYPSEWASSPMWGNHVASFLVVESGRKTLQERAASIQSQMDEAVRRFEHREAFWMYLLYELTPWFGRTAVNRILRNVRAKGVVPQSCHVSNLGNAGNINPPNARIRAIDYAPAVAMTDTVQFIVEIDDRISMPVMWERCESTPQDIQAHLQRLDDTVLRLLTP